MAEDSISLDDWVIEENVTDSVTQNQSPASKPDDTNVIAPAPASLPRVRDQDGDRASRNNASAASSSTSKVEPGGENHNVPQNNSNWSTWKVAVSISVLLISVLITWACSGGATCEAYPLVVTKSPAAANSLSVKWELVNEDGCKNVRLCISPDDQCQTVNGHAGTNVFKFLLPGQTYTATIITTSHSGSISKSSITDVTMALGLARSPQIADVAKNQITVSWLPPEGVYDLVRLICTSVDGVHQEVVDAPMRRSRHNRQKCTCVCLNSGTDYSITLVTMLNSDVAEPQMMIFENVIKTDRSLWNIATDNAVTIGAGIVGMAVAPFATPVILTSLGFGSGGIIAGSLGASLMSTMAVSKGGAIVAGSAIALLQSAGASGLGIISSTAISAIVGAIGAGVGAGAGGGIHARSTGRSTTCYDVGYCW